MTIHLLMVPFQYIHSHVKPISFHHKKIILNVVHSLYFTTVPLHITIILLFVHAMLAKDVCNVIENAVSDSKLICTM